MTVNALRISFTITVLIKKLLGREDYIMLKNKCNILNLGY
jgi:hypothetical protein